MTNMSVLDNRPALKAEINKVAEVAGYLWQKGWAERNGGNITINITEWVDDAMRALPAIGPVVPIGAKLPELEGCWFYCKGTGRRMRDLARDPMANGSIIRIVDDCMRYEIVADLPVAPTSELPSHLSVHNYLLAKGSPYRASLHSITTCWRRAPRTGPPCTPIPSNWWRSPTAGNGWRRTWPRGCSGP